MKRFVEPSPPPRWSSLPEHHWLQEVSREGHIGGVVVLQWNPSARRWSHSGEVGTGVYVDTFGWRYLRHCPMPDPVL